MNDTAENLATDTSETTMRSFSAITQPRPRRRIDRGRLGSSPTAASEFAAIPMRVLLINHTSEISGAEHSLISLLDSLPDYVVAGVACPPGDLRERVAERRIDFHPLGGTDGGPRFGAGSLRACAQVLRDALRVRQICERQGVDLVHANSLRSAVVGCLARMLGGAQVIVHVRDCFPAGEPLTRIARAFVSRSAATLVFNSSYTRDRFGNGIGRTVDACPWVVVHNGVDLDTFSSRGSSEQARRELDVEHRSVVLGVIGQMTPWKAHDDCLRMLAALVEMGHDAHLVIVGSAKFVKRDGRFDHPAYVASLGGLVRSLGLTERVSVMGERRDIPRVLEALDILLVPSLQEPFGRVVIEAMAMERTVVATSVGGPAEIIRHDRDGLLLPPRDMELWAREVHRLLNEPRRMTSMARSARQRVVEQFDSPRHATRMLDVYETALHSR